MKIHYYAVYFNDKNEKTYEEAFADVDEAFEVSSTHEVMYNQIAVVVASRPNGEKLIVRGNRYIENLFLAQNGL